MIVEVRNLYMEAQMSVTDVISQRQMQIVLTSLAGEYVKNATRT